MRNIMIDFDKIGKQMKKLDNMKDKKIIDIICVYHKGYNIYIDFDDGSRFEFNDVYSFDEYKKEDRI
jgi:hypothetical protein